MCKPIWHMTTSSIGQAPCKQEWMYHKLDSYFLTPSTRTRVYINADAPHWATPRANIAPLRCVVNYKYEHMRVCAHKLPWCLYIRWLSVTLAKAFYWIRYQCRCLESSAGLNSWVYVGAYAHVKMYARSMNSTAYACVHACMCAHTCFEAVSKYESTLTVPCCSLLGL